MTTYSEKTAIKRSSLSAPMKWLLTTGRLPWSARCLDFGCGHGMDAYRLKIEKYDPFYFPWDIEENVGKYDIITCNYVLNVLIPDDVEVVLYQIYRLLKVGGRAYITVRRGKLAEGKTSKGFQYSVVLPKFKSIRRTSSYEIYEMVGGA